MTAPDIVAIAADVTTSIAALVAVIIAGAGLSTWRRALKGQTEYELARRLMREVLRVRDAVEAFRDPFVQTAEAQSSDAESENSASDVMAGVFRSRWAPIVDAYSSLELELSGAEASVAWFNDLTKPREALDNVLKELRSSAVWFTDADRFAATQAKEKGRIRSIVMRGGAHEFDIQLHGAIDAFRMALRGHIHR
jgi:hypothetical protein